MARKLHKASALSQQLSKVSSAREQRGAKDEKDVAHLQEEVATSQRRTIKSGQKPSPLGRSRIRKAVKAVAQAKRAIQASE